jgi:hypothetical protein
MAPTLPPDTELTSRTERSNWGMSPNVSLTRASTFPVQDAD